MRAEELTVMILAGGLGTRLREVVGDRPKVLAEVAGRPFLAHLLDQVERAGVGRVVLCTGYLGTQVEEEFGHRYRSLRIDYSPEPGPAGTAGALADAVHLVDTPHVVVLNGDSYCDVELDRFVEWCGVAGAVAAMTVVEVGEVARYGQVRLVGDRVGVFTEKGAASGAGLINAGIYCFESDLLRRLPGHRPLSLEHQVLPGLLDLGLHAWPTRGRFIDIGTPQSYAAADAFFGVERVGLLILDRDGTVIREKHYLAEPEQVELLPGVAEALRRFQDRGYALAIVTNQSGIGRGYYDEAAFDAVNARMTELLGAAGVRLDGIWHCPHRPDEGCACRKPAPGMLQAAIEQLGFAPAQCLVVGDKDCDIDLGRRSGARTALVRTGYGADTEARRRCVPDVVVDGLTELASLQLAALQLAPGQGATPVGASGTGSSRSAS